MLTKERLAVLLLLAACGDDSSPMMDGGSTSDGSTDSMVTEDAPPVGPAPMAVLFVHALDLWGQALPVDEATLTVTQSGSVIDTVGWPGARVPLREAGSYMVRLEAAGHHTMETVINFDGGDTDDALTATTMGSTETIGGLLVAHGEEQIDPWPNLPTHRVVLGLRHRYFSVQGAPARRGNDITLYTSGEDGWAAVDAEIRSATESVHMASWWWQSNFELVRPEETHPFSSEAERSAATVLAALESNSATSRVLIGQLVSPGGVLSDITSDSAVQDRGATPSDDFEYMGQVNETAGRFEFRVEPMAFSDRVFEQSDENDLSLGGYRLDDDVLFDSVVPPHSVNLNDWPLGVSLELQAASWHQKFSVMDGDVAFVGGMNAKATDWDTDDHLVFDPRRMEFDSSTDQRTQVVSREREPDLGPRKDYVTRIAGPVVEDVNVVFEQRWSLLIDMGAEYADNASAFTAQAVPAQGNLQAQLTVTMPEPFWDHSIAETWFNAVREAEEYIFIEDQYWRVPMLVDAIIERMEEVPGLELVVMTKPINEFTDPGCEWTYITNDQLASMFPDRYTLLQLRAFDYTDDDFGPDETRGHFPAMDLHSKMLIVDDVFMSIGSANKNNRGIVYEGEMNLAVYDRDWVGAERARIVELVLPPGSTAMADARAWVEQLREAASWNDFVYENWDDEGFDLNLNGDPLPDMYAPRGTLYSMSFPDRSECLIEGVGADMM